MSAVKSLSLPSCGYKIGLVRADEVEGEKFEDRGKVVIPDSNDRRTSTCGHPSRSVSRMRIVVLLKHRQRPVNRTLSIARPNSWRLEGNRLLLFRDEEEGRSTCRDGNRVGNSFLCSWTTGRTLKRV